MRAYDVPPTPENYEIWYAQVSSQNADLNAAIGVYKKAHPG